MSADRRTWRARGLGLGVGLGVALVALAGCSSTSATTAAAPAAAPSTSTAPSGQSPSPTPTATASASPTPTKSATKPPPATRKATPSATSRATAPAVFRFPVPVSVGSATQVITVQAHGSYATVTGWERAGTGWRRVIATSAARIGSHGVVGGTARKQGTGKTPTGTYPLTEAFGIKADPGTTMPYHQVTNDDWWVEDNLSAYYNQLRRASQGGFDTSAPESSVNGSEHLITHTVPYQYAVVINYNMAPAVRYRGAGIFLHVNGAGSTAGCVSVPPATMVAILRWLNPGAHPRIAIA